MIKLEERKRSVNLDKLKLEQIDEISKQLGDKLKEILERATNEANELLGIYGLATKMQFLEPFDKKNLTKQQE